MQRKVEFDKSDLKELTPTPNLNLPDIEAKSCMIPKDGYPYMLFICKPKTRRFVCPNCGSVNIISHGSSDKPRIVRDINIGINRVDLLIEVPRYYCRDCDVTFRQEYESIPEKQQLTKRLLTQIKHDAFFRPFSDVAAEYGYSDTNIRAIFNSFVAELDARRPPITAPEVLGIDEKHINRQMRGIFVDIVVGKLIEITENNKSDTVIKTITNMLDYEKIRVVTMDMANGYRNQIQDILPDATIVVDKYHVFQALYRQLASVKKAIMPVVKNRTDTEADPAVALQMRNAYEIVLRNKYLFKFGKKKLNTLQNRLSMLSDVCSIFPEFNHLRLIKESFEQIYDEGVTRADAEALYVKWAELIPPTGAKKIAKWEQTYGVSADLFADLRTFFRTTVNWHEEIFNYFNAGCSYTNAAAEGVNSLLQRINSMGAGYGFPSLRARALYQNDVGGRHTYSLSKTYAKDFSNSFSNYTSSYFMNSFSGFSLNRHNKDTVTAIDVKMQIDPADFYGEVDPDWFTFYD